LLAPQAAFFFLLTRSHPPAGRVGSGALAQRSVCRSHLLTPRARELRAGGDARSIAIRVYVILLVLSGQVARTERNSTLIITRSALSLVLRMIVS
jgi:hypothetical protein